MTEYLERFQTIVQKEIQDPHYKITLSAEWASGKENYRVKIREHLADVDTSYFTKLQWAQLYDLNQRPTTKQGSISISHCGVIGGYSYSTFQHGFDIEDLRRISDPIIMRTSTDEERVKSPHIKMLWVAKEAAYKGLGEFQPPVITELTCKFWDETDDPAIWTFQINSKKEAPFQRNRGFVMGTPLVLFCAYFL